MLKTDRQIEAEAIGWVVRLRHADETDWEAFTLWLEIDPAHAAAYDRAALVDAEAETLLPPQPARPVLAAAAPFVAPPAPARGPGRRAVLGWGVAASLALIAGYATFGPGSGAYSLETAWGERREVALADGTRIELNGGTKVTLDRARPRFARLDRGEALFRIVHDPARPFEVEAGEARLRDLGTVFNVVNDRDMIEVAVSEGAVLYNPDGEATSLKPGMGLRKALGAATWVGAFDKDSVGGWREGRLTYSGAPIARIAADLSRNLGVQIRPAEAVSKRPFSGVILLEEDRQRALERASALLGLALERSGDGWILTTRAGASG
jgi:transmembrane sensor